MGKVCCCFGAGEFFGLCEAVPDGALVIAADAGIKTAKECGLEPDIVVGDFDSLGYIPEASKLVKLPAEKDQTDMAEAVDIGLERGCDEFLLYGATGGRLDHTLANIQLIAHLSAIGKRGFIYGNGFFLTAITSAGIRISGKVGDTVSVFSLTDRSDGVTLHGLKYPLENHTLFNTAALGVSNEFASESAEISVGNGTLLIYSAF